MEVRRLPLTGLAPAAAGGARLQARPADGHGLPLVAGSVLAAGRLARKQGAPAQGWWRGCVPAPARSNTRDCCCGDSWPCSGSTRSCCPPAALDTRPEACSCATRRLISGAPAGMVQAGVQVGGTTGAAALPSSPALSASMALPPAPLPSSASQKDKIPSLARTRHEDEDGAGVRRNLLPVCSLQPLPARQERRWALEPLALQHLRAGGRVRSQSGCRWAGSSASAPPRI